MRRVFAVGLLAAGVLVVALALAPAAVADTAADTAAIHARTQEFIAAWNKDDAKGMAAIWAPDGDLINPFGRVAKGRAAVETLFTDEHAGFMKGTTMKLDDESVRMLGPASALLEWDVEVQGIKGPDGAAAPPLKHHVTSVLAKKGGSWWVEAARPVVYQQPPGMAK